MNEQEKQKDEREAKRRDKMIRRRIAYGIAGGMLLVAVVFSIIGIVSCQRTKAASIDAPDFKKLSVGTMLFDYYDAVVGTEFPRGYDEVVLYAKNEKELTMTVYTKGMGEDAKEESEDYIVPVEAFRKVLRIFNNYRMSTWETSKNQYPVTGRAVVVKILNGEEYIRVTSDWMPQNGNQVYGEIASALYEYATEDRLVKK